MAHRARSAFEVDGLRKEMGGGKKRRLPSEEMRTVASFSTVSSSPSLFVTYRKSTKGVSEHKYTDAECENGWILLEHVWKKIIQKISQNLIHLKYHHPMTENKPLPFNGDPLRVLMTGTGLFNKSKVCSHSPLERNVMCRKEGQACAVCLSLDPSFEAASVFQQLTTFRWDCGVLWAE